MTEQERAGWKIVTTLFVVLFVVWGGGVNTGAVFFPALLKHFGWTRAHLSTLGSAGALAAGVVGPLVGGLVDRFEARRVMMAGAGVTALAFVFASRANSYFPLLIANLVIAIGVTGATIIPCSLIVSNWFGTRRGLALGVTFAGTSIGGMGMTMVSNYAIATGGWRTGYVTLALPMIFVVIPLVLLKVRSRPAGQASAPLASKPQSALVVPGLEIAEAIRTRSFWLISAAQFLYACSIAGAGLHLIAFLTGVGYTPNLAAGVLSLIFFLTSVGKLAMGVFADRVSARIALSTNFAFSMIGTAMLLGAGHTSALLGYVIFYGLTVGAPLVLMPMVMAESLGLRRLGSVMGTTGMFATVGAAVGPVLAGHIFDVSGSYNAAFIVFAAMWFAATVSIFGCRPLSALESRPAPVPATA
jgi:MFS family permease